MKKLTEEHKRKIGLANLGKKHHMFGKKHSEEVRRRISESLKGRKHTEETKRKMSEFHRGKRLTEEHKRKLSKNHVGMLGKHHTEEIKRKMSESRKGENNPMYGKMGNLHSRYGKSHSEETRQKLSEAKKGESNPNWKNGISFEPYSLEFNNQLKGQIRERDDYICQFCGNEENDRRHTLHHINYNKEDCRFLNLITVCVGCNGRANYSRDKWQMFFEILQELRFSFGGLGC